MPMQTLRRPLAACDYVGDQLISKVTVGPNPHNTIGDGSLFEQGGSNFRQGDLMVANPTMLAGVAYQFQIASLVQPCKIPGRRQSLLELRLRSLAHIRSLDIDLACDSNRERLQRLAQDLNERIAGRFADRTPPGCGIVFVKTR